MNRIGCFEIAGTLGSNNAVAVAPINFDMERWKETHCQFKKAATQMLTKKTAKEYSLSQYAVILMLTNMLKESGLPFLPPFQFPLPSDLCTRH